MPEPKRCALTWCASTDGTRMFIGGLRCRTHSPAALAGDVEPSVIAAISRRNWAASLAAASTTTQEAA